MTTAEEDDEWTSAECANPGCQIAAGGRCLEGFTDVSACPQYGKSLTSPVIGPTPARPVVTMVRLTHAEALSNSEATMLLGRGPSNVISLVGPFDSGKTSLIAGMYDLLQRGPVGGYAFAGSSTMHSFERACHDSRRESERHEAHMERTERGEVLFFHLDLVSTDDGIKRAALLGNRAGEEYATVQDDPDSAKRFPELRRADVLTVLVDGAKLLDAGERHEIRAHIRIILRALIEVNVVPPWQRLALVLTKIDAVRNHEAGTAAALRSFESLVGQVRLECAAHFASVQAFRVAASPKTAEADRGEGMDELLRYWMAEPQRNVPDPVAPETVEVLRSFGRLPSDLSKAES